MSHDPEAVIANVLRGPLPLHGSPEDHAGRVLDALAAAGYTVTKGCYEPATYGVVSRQDDGTVIWNGALGEIPIEPDQWEPLYRKIEGSTDGADRD